MSFDSVESSAVAGGGGGGGSGRCTGRKLFPTLEEVKQNSSDYSLFFEDIDMLKTIDLSPVLRGPPVDLVPILGVCVNQVNVFHGTR